MSKQILKGLALFVILVFIALEGQMWAQGVDTGD
jgi:hypothetical protein